MLNKSQKLNVKHLEDLFRFINILSDTNDENIE